MGRFLLWLAILNQLSNMVSVLLHMLMACANSASAIFEFHGPISPVARKFESFSNVLHILYIEFACAEEGLAGLLLTMLLCMAFLI